MSNDLATGDANQPPNGSFEEQLAASTAELRRARAEQKRLELIVKGLSGALREQADEQLKILDRLQQREEEALRRSEQRFARLLESAGEAIYGIDDEGRVTFVNPAAARLLDVDPATLLDRQVRSVLRHAHHERAQCDDDRCDIVAPLHTGEASRGEAVVIRADGGQVPVEFISTPIGHAAGGGGAVVVLRDMTDRRQVEEERTRLMQDLQASVAARDDFLSIASHELRTPLTPLRFQVHRLKRVLTPGQSVDPEQVSQLAQAIDRQLDRLQALIEQLLDVSRITVGRLALQRQRVDLAALTRDVVARMRIEFTQAATAVTVDAPAPVIGHWDIMRLEQVVTNLLSNAVKYGAGKPVTVSVTALPDHARLQVEDYGIGMAAGDQRRIFDRFERLVSVRHYSGFGLGLWIVREIVEAHGGTVEVTSALGHGSTFSVLLPRTDAATTSEATDGSPTRA